MGKPNTNVLNYFLEGIRRILNNTVCTGRILLVRILIGRLLLKLVLKSFFYSPGKKKTDVFTRFHALPKRVLTRFHG